jgi:hypothetical protein
MERLGVEQQSIEVKQAGSGVRPAPAKSGGSATKLRFASH